MSIIKMFCTGNKDATNLYTLILDMANNEWKDKNKTGYKSATKMDGIPVLIDYSEKNIQTTLSYNSSKRFIVKAVAKNLEPNELWNYLKQLNIEKLINE